MSIKSRIGEWLQKHVWDLFRPKTKPAPMPDPVPEPTACCNLAGPLVTPPEKGGECLTPFGKDIRFRGCLPQGDTVFIGNVCLRHNAVSVSGDVVTARCFSADGYRYHCIGYRTPGSKSPLVHSLVGLYQETYRIDFEVRKE